MMTTAMMVVEAIYGDEDNNDESIIEIKDLVNNTNDKMATRTSHILN
jgi:hypothetical protein